MALAGSGCGISAATALTQDASSTPPGALSKHVDRRSTTCILACHAVVPHHDATVSTNPPPRPSINHQPCTNRLLELTGAKEPAALEKLVKAVGVNPASVNKDLLMYKGVLSKLSAAKVSGWLVGQAERQSGSSVRAAAQ